GWLCFDILGFLDHLQNPTMRNVMDWVFTAIVGVTVLLLARALVRVFRSAGSTWQPSARREALAALAVLLVALDVGVALYSPPFIFSPWPRCSPSDDGFAARPSPGR